MNLSSHFSASEEGPITIVFGTFNYLEQVILWTQYARKAGCSHYRIICIDDELLRHLRDNGQAPNAVSYHGIFPDAEKLDSAGQEMKKLKPTLWQLRVKLWLHLVEHGYDFIHSDADAIWIKDPRPWLARHSDHDLLISQGGDGLFYYPHTRFHHFILCAGFFLARSSERTRTYFERVSSLMEVARDDQVCMNAALTRKPVSTLLMLQQIPSTIRSTSTGIYTGTLERQKTGAGTVTAPWLENVPGIHLANFFPAKTFHPAPDPAASTLGIKTTIQTGSQTAALHLYNHPPENYAGPIQ